MIGILSDSHDNIDAVRDAVNVFKKRGCDLVIHAGDFVAPFAARELLALPCRVKAVFGNCDGEKRGLTEAIHPLGEIKAPPFPFVWKGRAFLLTHTDFFLDVLIARHSPQVLIYGHTHKPEIAVKGGTLRINPGEAGGWVSGRRTVALLDVETEEAEIVTL